MSVHRTIALVLALMPLVSCASRPSTEQSEPVSRGIDGLTIELDADDPSKSEGFLPDANGNLRFPVGYGRRGLACAGSWFQDGWTPLGRFRVNGILSDERFEMDPELIASSGRTEQELRSTLFRNMSSIDFKGDGLVGEYGIGYISLEPVPATPQPFSFNTYNGRFRWYSFAIHGSNDESRIGKTLTGGCINVDRNTLETLLERAQLGDEILIQSDGPCED
mgnify:FL=1